MKFPGTCIVCHKKVVVNEIGLWAQGIGVKHERCATTVTELKCIACGSPAGCSTCEFKNICDIPNVSQACMCTKCSGMEDAFARYQRTAGVKFPSLKPKT